MALRKINIYLISIIFIASIAIILFNWINSNSVSNSSDVELSPQNTLLIKSTIKETDDIPTKRPNANAFAGKPIQNAQMVVMHKPSWKLDGNFKDHLDKLIIIAASGDNEANYIIAMNFRHCYYAPVDETALEKKLEQAYEYSDADIAVDKINERYKYCFGIKQKQRNQFYKYLEVASLSLIHI